MRALIPVVTSKQSAIQDLLREIGFIKAGEEDEFNFEEEHKVSSLLLTSCLVVISWLLISK